MLLYELEGKNKELCKAYEELKMSESMLIQSERWHPRAALRRDRHELKNPSVSSFRDLIYPVSSRTARSSMPATG